ncbi:anti-sigma regulatory factor [Vibrio atypicus]|uniref:anti-sigma regulatory factor n=1 Tax=Vibrio atypicus TaxID=558271 RepID=UPI003734F7F6
MTTERAEQIIESYFIATESDVMSAVIAVYTLLQNLSFSASQVSEVSTSVSELGMNIVKYVGDGVVTVVKIEEGNVLGVKIVAKDSGCGITNIEAALADNFSTGGSLGMGLPGVKRMMDEFEVESSPDNGTIVTAIKWKE